MFGYIKPMIPELRVREHELYKSIYCGLCRSMGEHICNSNRLTLSYDIVFLALVRCALSDEKIHVEKGRCIVHPIKTRNHAFIPETLKYCSKVSAILTYYNIQDDIKDSKSIRPRLLLPHAKKYLRKAGMPELGEKTEVYLNELSALEKEGGSLDRNAECFGRLLGEVFAYDMVSATAYEIGYHVGKWIYITDACDDYEKDRKSGEYNPLSSYDTLPREALSVAATLELSSACIAFQKADIKNEALKSIINNILTLGMPEVQDKILGEKK